MSTSKGLPELQRYHGLPDSESWTYLKWGIKLEDDGFDTMCRLDQYGKLMVHVTASSIAQANAWEYLRHRLDNLGYQYHQTTYNEPRSAFPMGAVMVPYECVTVENAPALEVFVKLIGLAERTKAETVFELLPSDSQLEATRDAGEEAEGGASSSTS